MVKITEMEKLTSQEYSSIVVQISRAIDDRFMEDEHYAVSLAEAKYLLNEKCGFHEIYCRVICQKHENPFQNDIIDEYDER